MSPLGSSSKLQVQSCGSNVLLVVSHGLKSATPRQVSTPSMWVCFNVVPSHSHIVYYIPILTQAGNETGL